MEYPKSPLEGIKVLDFGQAALTPVCGRLLADFGADVIKVEPLEGDLARITAEPMVDSVTFIVNNLNKRSIAVNLREEEGREVIRKLIKDADVLIQNFRPGVMKKLTLDYESVSAINPMLVYGSFYMYGETGPLARRRGGDMWAQAFTGMVESQGCANAPPQIVAHTVIDFSGGVVAALAVMTALLVRERTGIGQEVTSSLINTSVLLQWPAIGHYLMEGVQLTKPGRGSARSRFPYGAYTAKDGDVLTIFGQDDDEWVTVCSMLGIEHLLADPRYDTAEKRNEAKLELYPILDEAFSKRTREEWAQIFKENRLRCDPCLDYSEFVAHPQFEENKLALKVNDPRDGEIRVPSTPIRFKKFPPVECRRHSPILGEHTKEILKELNYSDEVIAEFHDKGVVGSPTADMFKAKRTLKGTKSRGKRYMNRATHVERVKSKKA